MNPYLEGSIQVFFLVKKESINPVSSFPCLAPGASASRRFGPAWAAQASSQSLQRVSALGERLTLFFCLAPGSIGSRPQANKTCLRYCLVHVPDRRSPCPIQKLMVVRLVFLQLQKIFGRSNWNRS
jgi:hypothetical protein